MQKGKDEKNSAYSYIKHSWGNYQLEKEKLGNNLMQQRDLMAFRILFSTLEKGDTARMVVAKRPSINVQNVEFFFALTVSTYIILLLTEKGLKSTIPMVCHEKAIGAVLFQCSVEI